MKEDTREAVATKNNTLIESILKSVLLDFGKRHWRPLLLGWKPSLLGWVPLLLGWRERLEAIALRFDNK